MERRPVSRRSPDHDIGIDRDAGFTLLSVMWLLLLGGAIGATLLALSLRDDRLAHDIARRTRLVLAIDSAVDMTLHELALPSARARWMRLPASVVTRVGDIAVSVDVSEEAGRLDLASADLRFIDHVLMGLGFDGSERIRFISALNAHRGGFDRVVAPGWDDLRVLTGDNWDMQACLAPLVTFFTGLQRPNQQNLVPDLRRAIGGGPSERRDDGGAGGSSQNAGYSGHVLRLDVIAGDGRSLQRLRAIVRLTGRIDKPVLVHVWDRMPLTGSCGVVRKVAPK